MMLLAFTCRRRAGAWPQPGRPFAPPAAAAAAAAIAAIAPPAVGLRLRALFSAAGTPPPPPSPPPPSPKRGRRDPHPPALKLQRPAGRPPLTASAAAAAREDIYTVPNLLTASRLAAAPVVGWCILHDHHAWALALFAYAGVTDVVDGWVARTWHQRTVVGTVVDPLADKILMAVLAVALAVKGALPVWLAAVILGRDVGLGVAAVRCRWISLPPPKTVRRYWDFSLPSAEVRPTAISKANTFLQLALMGATTLAPLVPALAGTPLAIMQYTVAVTTVWSGASYIYSKDAVKILTSSTQQKRAGDRKPAAHRKP